MASTIFFLFSSSLILSNWPLFVAAADIRTTTALLRSQLTPEPADIPIPPTTFFEVTNPIPLPNTKPCSYLLLQHDFAYTYGKPPVLADYNPPTDCPSQNFETIVLEWTAASRGRQFDRIFGVWLGGVEILRSCTAEPRATGIVWTVKKDITRYKSLLKSNQTLAVYLGNIVDATYTGVYHVNVSLHFYPVELDRGIDYPVPVADLILPISRNLPLNDGLWFEIKNSTDVQSKEFAIPRNTYRAVLEVYVSFHESDEFWYSNLPNAYISANNLTGTPGNGPFREIIVELDGFVAGAVWPFTVIYTGGVNPLLWRPITGIGSFDLPSYDIEITPLLGKLLDGHLHKLAFSVTNALNVWYVDANLHLWVDPKKERTQGKLLQHHAPPLWFSSHLNFSDLDGSFATNARRVIASTGYVKTSRGLVVTEFLQELKYINFMIVGNEGNLQIVNQSVVSNATVDTKTSEGESSIGSRKVFSVFLYMNSIDRGNGTVESVANVSLGVEAAWKRASGSAVSEARLENRQEGEGSVVVKGNLVLSGSGSTQQVYSFEGEEKSCYFRNVSSSNYAIVYDEERKRCSREKSRFVPRKSLLGIFLLS